MFYSKYILLLLQIEKKFVKLPNQTEYIPQQQSFTIHPRLFFQTHLTPSLYANPSWIRCCALICRCAFVSIKFLLWRCLCPIPSMTHLLNSSLNISFSKKPSLQTRRLGSSSESSLLLEYTSRITLFTPSYAIIC